MTDHAFIYLHRDRGTTVKSFKTASRAKSTVVTVEIEVTDHYELSGLLSQLHEAKHPPKPKAKPARASQDRLALPAPSLRLSDMRDDV